MRLLFVYDCFTRTADIIINKHVLPITNCDRGRFCAVPEDAIKPPPLETSARFSHGVAGDSRKRPRSILLLLFSAGIRRPFLRTQGFIRDYYATNADYHRPQWRDQKLVDGYVCGGED